MTAIEAMQTSASGVVRAPVDGGLVTIGRSPDGFQVTFIPRTEEAAWNLAGSVIHGSFSTLDQAERAAGIHEWEPAPENIIGNGPVHSVGPDVEGHHIHPHGDPHPPHRT